MQVLLKSLAVTLAIICSTATFAQSKQQVFADLEKIIQRAEGQKIESRGLTTPGKITKQQFTESSVSIATKNTAKKSTEISYTYSEIPWNELYKYTIDQDDENEKVYEVTMYFDKNLKTTFNSEFEKDKVQSPNSLVTLYIRTKDFAAFDQQIKALGKVVPNKIKG